MIISLPPPLSAGRLPAPRWTSRGQEDSEQPKRACERNCFKFWRTIVTDIRINNDALSGFTAKLVSMLTTELSIVSCSAVKRLRRSSESVRSWSLAAVSSLRWSQQAPILTATVSLPARSSWRGWPCVYSTTSMTVWTPTLRGRASRYDVTAMFFKQSAGGYSA